MKQRINEAGLRTLLASVVAAAVGPLVNNVQAA